MGTNRATGLVLWACALVLAFAAVAWWLWENSDSRENERETKALTAAMSGGDYDEPDPNAAPSIVLGAVSAVLFVGGAVFLASPQPQRSDASDRQ